MVKLIKQLVIGLLSLHNSKPCGSRSGVTLHVRVSEPRGARWAILVLLSLDLSSQHDAHVRAARNSDRSPRTGPVRARAV